MAKKVVDQLVEDIKKLVGAGEKSALTEFNYQYILNLEIEKITKNLFKTNQEFKNRFQMKVEESILEYFKKNSADIMLEMIEEGELGQMVHKISQVFLMKMLKQINKINIS